MTWHYCQGTLAFRISSRCHLFVPVILFLFLLILVIAPVHAAVPLAVTVTASPSSLVPGESSSLQVTVLSNGYPLRGATVTLSGESPSGSFSASAGLTDTAGRFTTVLSTTSTATGTIHVIADASYTPFVSTYVPETSYGSGFTDVVIAVSQQQPLPEPPAQLPMQPPVGVISVDKQSGAVPLTIRFDGTGSYDPDGSISDYSWSYGDGSAGSGYVSFHTYENPGIYPAMLTVTDNAGLISLPVGEEITVQDTAIHASTAGPVALIEVNRSYGPAPLSVTFDGSKSSDPSGTIVSWRWDFGDGTSARGPVVNHTFSVPGSFTCSLAVTGANGIHSDTSLIQIIVEPSLPVMGSTNAPSATPPPTLIIVPDPDISADSKVNTTASVLYNPPRPLSSFIPPAFAPLAGISAGIIIGAVGSVLSRSKPPDPAARKFQEFVKSMLGKRGVSAIAAWEKKKQKIDIIRRKELFAGLSLVEILVALASAILIGTAFYLVSPNPDRFLFTLVLFIAAGGAVVVLHDLSRRWVARRHGQYGEYRVWPLGTVIMFLTAGFFGCACGKPSRPVFEDRGDTSTRDRAVECLTGPVLSCIFGCLFLVLIPSGGLAATVGRVGFSMNIVLALYSLMPFEPMDGPKVWAWNRAAYLAIFIPLLVIYIGSAYLIR